MQKPPKSYSVTVPTKAYLRKYIIAEFGQPFILSYHSTLGTLILSMLGREDFTIKMSESKMDQRIQFMNAEFEVFAPLSTMHYKGHSLSKDQIIAINRYIEDLFVEDLHRYCKFNIKETNWRPGIKDAIYAFAESYDIEMEVDVTFEALKKAEFRYKKRVEEKKSKNNLVTFVPGRESSIQSSFFPSFAF